MENKSSKFLAFVWVALGALARLLPHLPNLNPVVSVSLFAGKQLSRGWAVASIVSLMFLTDLALASLHGHETFGWWSLFTYSGMIAIALFGRGLKGAFQGGRAIGFTLSASLAFWLWSNFGTWLTSGMYGLDSAGLMQCYLAALPFLGYSLVGDLGWMLTLFLSYQGANAWMLSRDVRSSSASLA